MKGVASALATMATIIFGLAVILFPIALHYRRRKLERKGKKP